MEHEIVHLAKDSPELSPESVKKVKPLGRKLELPVSAHRVLMGENFYDCEPGGFGEKFGFSPR